MLIYTLCAISVIAASVFYLFFYRNWRRDSFKLPFRRTGARRSSPRCPYSPGCRPS